MQTKLYPAHDQTIKIQDDVTSGQVTQFPQKYPAADHFPAFCSKNQQLISTRWGRWTGRSSLKLSSVMKLQRYVFPFSGMYLYLPFFSSHNSLCHWGRKQVKYLWNVLILFLRLSFSVLETQDRQVTNTTHARPFSTGWFHSECSWWKLVENFFHEI